MSNRIWRARVSNCRVMSERYEHEQLMAYQDSVNATVFEYGAPLTDENLCELGFPPRLVYGEEGSTNNATPPPARELTYDDVPPIDPEENDRILLAELRARRLAREQEGK